jgi:hypothetical protein
MSLDKAINSGKEYRKNYFGSKRFDRTCRNHGKCPYCENNRTFSTEKRKIACQQQENEVDCPNEETTNESQKEN